MSVKRIMRIGRGTIAVETTKHFTTITVGDRHITVPTADLPYIATMLRDQAASLSRTASGPPR